MADKTPSDVPPIPIPPIVDLAGTGAEPGEETVVRPRKKAEPKVVPPAEPAAVVEPEPTPVVEPVEAPPVVAAAAPVAPEVPAAPNPYAQPKPYAQAPAAPNPYAQAPAAPNPYAQAPAAPNPYAAAPPAPGAPQPYAYGPYVPQPPKGLSITSLILGIVGVVFCGTLFLVSVAAIVTGHLAAKRQPYAKGMWLTGLITGYVGAGIGLIWIGLWTISLIASLSRY